MDKSLSLGMTMLPLGYIQELQASKLGDAQGIPFFINKNIRFLFQYTIFLLLHILCVILGASLFLFLVWFILVCFNNWLDPSLYCFGERHAPFSLQRTLWFHSYSPASV